MPDSDRVFSLPQSPQPRSEYYLLQDGHVDQYVTGEFDTKMRRVGNGRYISEALTGTIDGSNASFTTTFSFVPDTLEIFVNGLKQKLVSDYNTSGNDTVLFSISPEINDSLTASYFKLT